MLSSQWIPFLFGCFLLSWYLSRRLVVLAPRFGLLDRPNERSSHSVPTPRGGGLAIVLVVLLGGALGHTHWQLLDTTLLVGLGLAGLIGVVGFLDDRYQLSVAWRLLSVLGASLIALSPFIVLRDLSGELVRWPGEYLFLIPLGVLGFTWFTNLFNFMDGIDGLAAFEAVLVLSTFGVFFNLTGDQTLLFLSMVGAIASFGFLLSNWSPAKIFMGDVGSYFLGFLISLLIFWGHLRGTLPLTSSLLIVGVFAGDATWTLVMRLLRGQKIAQAHKEHGYQRLHQRGWKHGSICLLYGLWNLIWFFPLSHAAARFPIWSWEILGLGYGIFFIFLWAVRAGGIPSGPLTSPKTVGPTS